MTQKSTFFQERIISLNKEIESLKSDSRNLSTLRILAFLVFIVAFIYILNIKVFVPLVLLTFLFFTGFGLVVRWHNKIRQSLELRKKLKLINNEEIDRLNFSFKNFHQWNEFVDEKHKYSGDLDLYGKNSLFQLLNRAETPAGIQLMKAWLENYSDKSTIETRQKAIQELIPDVEWRQQIQAYGRQNSVRKNSSSDLHQWLGRKDELSNHSILRILPIPIIVIAAGLLLAILYQIIPFYFLFPLIIINGILLLKVWDYSKSTYESTSSSMKLLESIQQILRLVENRDFVHPHLQELQSKLSEGQAFASKKILKLQKIFDLLNLRGNQIYHIFNALFLLDFIFLMKAERWRKKYKNEVVTWFNTIAEFESLNSIGAFAFANDHYKFPKIVNNGLHFSCHNMGHPLIPKDQRVSNDFELKGKGEIGIVTGSNMSGKSTFLRTVGVNAVLAFLGAPVCADNMELSIFQVFTSMRTKDNLEENTSSFYAELLRLKLLLENINDQRPVLFLLDEILKGTNSTDRHIGAESLAIQLSKLNAFGLISTHDLKLGELELKADKLKNYNFSSSIDGQEIIFDYKLRDGICKSTNASQLMAKIGIQINLST